MATLQFGTALFHSKAFSTTGTTTGQNFKTSPSSSTVYATSDVSGLVSGRNGYDEDYRYGIQLDEVSSSQLSKVYNGNGVQLHPIITFATTKTIPVYERYLAGGPAGSTILNVYKGVKPSSTDLVTNLNNFSSDLLISFSIPEGIKGIRCLTHDLYNAADITINSTFKNPGEVSFLLGICPSRTTAIQSGLATWFWFGNSSNQTDLSDISFVIGEIGETDDGSCDMYIPNANISAGENYMSGGFKFTFPSIINL